MKTMLAAILLCFFVTGCGTSYIVSSSSEDTSIDEFNYFAQGQEAEIILIDDTIITATDLYLSADSLYWIDTETKLKTSVVKSEVREAIPASDLYLTADSLHWFNPETTLKTGVVKSEVRKVIFSKNFFSRGLQGAGFGLKSGALAGLLLAGLINESETAEWGDLLSFIILPVTGAVCGALIGFPIGLIAGHTYEYEFQTTEPK
jgi:hypothetical protein